MIAQSQARTIQAFNDGAKAAGWTFTCGPAQDFTHPQLTAALALWQGKAQGRSMPRRADMTARAMLPYMPHMSLLERTREAGKTRYRVRLHGSALARYIGDHTGKFVDDAIPPERLDAYTALYDTVLELLVPLRAVIHYQLPQISYLMGESLLAPLSVPDSQVPLLLSITYAQPRPEFSAPGDARF